MGIIKQGILGGFKGKVGSVIGTSWKGKAVMKAMPLSVANPRTAPQVLQRGKFTSIVKLASGMLSSIVKPLWDKRAVGMSGYNAFCSANIKAFNPSGAFVPAEFNLGKGRLLNPTISTAVYAAGVMTVTLQKLQDDPLGLPTDEIGLSMLSLRQE